MAAAAVAARSISQIPPIDANQSSKRKYAFAASVFIAMFYGVTSFDLMTLLIQ